MRQEISVHQKGVKNLKRKQKEQKERKRNVEASEFSSGKGMMRSITVFEREKEM